MRMLFFIVVAFLLGGCSIPRAGELWLLTECNAPRATDLKPTDLSIEAAPAESYPSASVSYKSSLPATDMMQTISDQLVAKGWKAIGEATVLNHETQFRHVQHSFESGDYYIYVNITRTRESPDDPDNTSGFIRFETRHPWDERPWIMPRYLLWRIFNNKYIAGLL